MLLSLIYLGTLISISLIFIETNRRKFLSPFLFIMLIYFAYYVLRSFVIYINLDDMEPYFQEHLFNVRHLEEALLLVSISFVFLYVGYKAGISNKINKTYKIGVDFNIKNINKLMTVNFLIFLIWFSIIIYKNTIDLVHYAGAYSVEERLAYGFPYILSLFSTLSSFSFYFIMYIYFAYNIHKKYFIFALMAKLLIGVVGGDVLGLAFLLFSYVIIVIWGGRFGITRTILHFPRWKIVIYGFLSFFSLFAMYFFKVVSRRFSEIGIRPMYIFENFESAWVILENISLSGILSSMTSRFIGIDTLANIIGAIDLGVVEHKIGYIFYLLSIGLVPRFIFHDKPEIALAIWYTDNIWNTYVLENGYQGTGMYIPGEFYLNFGAVGVVIGMLIYGYLLGLLYKVTFYNSYKMFSFVFISTMSIYYIIYEFTFSAWVIGFIRTYFMLYIYSILLLLLMKIRFK